MNESWFVPTYDPEDHIGTWIGYRILDKKPYARVYQQGRDVIKPIKVRFRLSFVGLQAEELSDQTMLWEDRTDVTKLFEQHQVQINYNERAQFSYPVKEGGLNDHMCWCVDMSVQTFYSVDTKQIPWILPQ